ncbi:MAG: lipoyl(octanoyl) transferase LipB [Bacteroidetes bacterium]|nr:lipoyl(octanoyl) transferase LipB [Bacteroidota bacterium]
MSQRLVTWVDLGASSYHEAWDLQRLLQGAKILPKLSQKSRAMKEVELEEVRQRLQRENAKFATLAQELPVEHDVVLLTQHRPVYTLGKSGDAAHLLLSEERLAAINAEWVKSDRGGDITFHGPGQWTGYPILDLDHYGTDIHLYLRNLEQWMIRTAQHFDVESTRIEGLTGTWVEDRKLCAFGVKCSRWVTMHGFALNVHTDLSYFDYIVPCGIKDKHVTSLSQELGRPVAMNEVIEPLVESMKAVFNVQVDLVQVTLAHGQIAL